MEPNTIASGMQWIGIAVTGLGVGSVILYLLKRWFTAQDNKKKLNETNTANQLTADAGFRDDLIERVNVLEARVDKLQDELNSQMKENAKLSAENDWLKKDNLRMEKEIEKLREDRRASDITISGLRSELDALKLVVTNYQQGKIEQPFEVKLVGDVVE